jgi:hypothetical protein
LETSQWVNEGLDDLGPAMLSITGDEDQLRMHCLLAYVHVKPAKSGASLTWEGAWEYDPISGTGGVKLVVSSTSASDKEVLEPMGV